MQEAVRVRCRDVMNSGPVAVSVPGKWFRRLKLQLSSQRIAKRAGGTGPRQKTSKIVKKCQKVFRHFSTIFAQGKKRQKSPKSVKNIFDIFRLFSRRAPFFRPFLGGSEVRAPSCAGAMKASAS